MYRLFLILLMPVLLWGNPLTVNEAINSAKMKNKDILIERKTLTEKRLNLSESVAAYLPSINLNGSRSKNGMNTPYNNVLDSSYYVGISLSQPIFNYNLIENISESNLAKVREKLSFEVLKRTVEINTISKFYSTIALKSELKAAEFMLKRSKENYSMVKDKYAIGSANRSDFLKAKVDYLNASINCDNLKTQLEIAKKDLFSYIGMKSDTFELVDNVVVDTFSLPETDSLKAELIRYDPQILSSRLNLQYVASNLRREIASFLPSVYLNISYNTRLDSFPSFSRWKNGDSWSTSISFSIPLFEGGTRGLEIAKEKVDYQKAKLNYRKELDARTDALIDQISNLKTSYISYKSAKEAEKLAKENFDINELLYKKGQISQIEYYDAERGFEEAESNLIKAKYMFLTSKLKLKIMIGSWKGD